MKLIQLNAWGGRLDNTLSDFLEQERPDIFCGQEIISYPKNHSILFLSLEDMQRITKLDNSVFGATASFPFMKGYAEFGNTIISRFPIAKSSTIFTNLEFTENFSPKEHDYNIRNFLHTVIPRKGKSLNIVTHHGHHVHEHKNGNEETDRQMKMIADYIQTLEGPVILSGDFNLHPGSKSLLPINQLMTNLSDKYSLTTTRNELTSKTEVCDHIFVNKDIKVKKFYAHSRIVSDHQALVMEFEI